MVDLSKLALSNAIQLGAQLRKAGEGVDSMESAASAMVRYLYDNLRNPKGAPAFVLVRLYKTHPFGDLQPDLQAFAEKLLQDGPRNPQLRCLTLLGTVGEDESWNDRKKSRGHKAIPLPSEDAVKQIPMVLQLVRQLGLSVSDVVKPKPELILELEQKTFNVFHVEEAPGSEYIPAQADFVIEHGVHSVVGFGGMLPSGDMFAVIGFSNVAIKRETAELFKTLALNVKLGLVPFVDKKVFA